MGDIAGIWRVFAVSFDADDGGYRIVFVVAQQHGRFGEAEDFDFRMCLHFNHYQLPHGALNGDTGN